jgi:hypothetical protein
MTLKLWSLALLAGLALTTVPQVAHAQKKGELTTRATKSRGTGADSHIKSDSVINSTTKTFAPPPEKGGAKTRGAAVGRLHIDNRTQWYIRIYVDGDLQTIVAPWGDYWANGRCDEYTLYAVARFTDGSSYTWGPATTDSGCDGQVWTLRE